MQIQLLDKSDAKREGLKYRDILQPDSLHLTFKSSTLTGLFTVVLFVVAWLWFDASVFLFSLFSNCIYYYSLAQMFWIFWNMSWHLLDVRFTALALHALFYYVFLNQSQIYTKPFCVEFEYLSCIFVGWFQAIHFISTVQWWLL